MKCIIFFISTYNKKRKKGDMLQNNRIDHSKLNKLISRTNRVVKIFYILLVASITLASIYVLKETKILNLFIEILKVLSPIFIGFIIAFLLYPLVKKLKDKNISNTLSCLIVYLVLVVIIFLFVKMFIPVLYKQINDLIKSLPNILNEVNKGIDKLFKNIPTDVVDSSKLKGSIVNFINNYSLSFSKKMPNHIINFTISFIGVLGIILTGFVVGLYMLLDFDKIYNRLINIIPSKYCKDCKNLFNNIAQEVRKTVNGTFLVALMVLVGDTILFTIFKLESPLLFGIICGLTDLIPYIGPYIGGGIATIVGFTSSTKTGIAILISCFIIQVIENNLLQPVVMSKTTKLHPIVIIASLLIFGHFFGIIGMMLATPIATLIKCIYDYFKDKHTCVN